jgi:hypothetical protein
MARIKGLLKFTGKLGELSAYMTQDGIVLRARSGPDKKQFKNNPAFSAAYKQSLEFGACAKAGSLLRKSVQLLIYKTCDNRLSSRLNKTMNDIKNLDVVSEIGRRSVDNGLKDPKAATLLKGINLNIHAKLSQIIAVPYRVDMQKQVIDYGNIDLKKAVKAPKGATEICVKGAHAVIDFDKQDFYTVEDSATLSLNGGAASLTLDLKNNSALRGLHLYVLKVSFFQEVNGVLYEMEDAAWRGCGVVGAFFEN